MSKLTKASFEKLKEKGELIEIQRVILPDSGDGLTIFKSDDTQSLYWYHEYLGDYAINWIIVWANEQETERVNAKYVESILWNQEQTEGNDE